MADMEALALSGQLFEAPSSTPPHDSDDSDSGSGIISFTAPQDPAYGDASSSIGMGDGRTGVKGVIRDRAEADKLERERREREAQAMRRRMEKGQLGGKTFLEEEKDRVDTGDRMKKGRFGHLREVGVRGFVKAVEQEQRGTYVVVHLYDSSLDRCYALDDTLARLARRNTDVKFLRARAASLGFACLPSSRTEPRFLIKRAVRPPPEEKDEDEAYSSPEEKVSEDEEEDEKEADIDVLPTMLVYRDGDLVFNWVRVDWVAGKAGIEELLSKHRVILPRYSGDGHAYSDEELTWTDEESITAA